MLKKNKVCFPFVGDSIGGSHLSSIILIQELENTHFIPLVVLHKLGPLATYLDERNIDYIVLGNDNIVGNLPLISQVLKIISCAFTYAGFLKHNNISIVHTNDLRMHMTWLIATRMAGIKMLWHQRTANDSRRNGIYTSFACKVVTISNFCKSVLPGKMGTRAITVYNPFVSYRPDNKTTTSPFLLKEIGLSNNNVKIIGFVGSLVKQKRPEIFIEIANALNQLHNQTLVFVMIGRKEPNIMEQLSKLIIKLGLEKNVFILGSRFPIEKWACNFDLLISPGVNEGFGRTLVEAMLLGVPVLASDSGGHKEIIRNSENGFLAEVDNIEDFSNKADYILKNPNELKQITSFAQNEALERFGVNHHVKAIINIYNIMV